MHSLIGHHQMIWFFEGTLLKLVTKKDSRLAKNDHAILHTHHFRQHYHQICQFLYSFGSALNRESFYKWFYNQKLKKHQNFITLHIFKLNYSNIQYKYQVCLFLPKLVSKQLPLHLHLSAACG